MDIPQHSGFIDGGFIHGSGALLRVENPSEGRVFADLPGLSQQQIESAIRSSRQAFDNGQWSGLTAARRAETLRRFVSALESRVANITDLIVAEAGCPRHSPVMAAQLQIPLKQARDIIDLCLSLPEVEENPLPLRDRITPMGQVVQSMRRYTPIGVVAGIAAYNFPFYTALWKVMPALLTGNTVVLRPSPLTPLSAMALADAAIEAELPRGVLNIVLEAGLEGGKLLTTDPAVDMVAFTGSTRVGEMVMAQAAPTMKRLQLELGGKSAQIIMPDAIEQALPAAMGVCLGHAGQGCAHGTRILVPESERSQILQQLSAAFASIKTGGTEDKDTQMGPVISAAQVERCEHYVAAARKSGGTVVFGGRRPAHLDNGYFFEPTLLDLPDNSNPAAQDEIFGPVVSVIGYRDLEHAVAMANDSKFGLSGYVFGKDVKAALELALQIKSGTVNVNTGLMSSYVSSGGQRASGIGRERGVEGLRIYQQMTCFNFGR